MKYKYHLRIYNDDTFQEEWYFKFTRLKGYILIFCMVFLIISMITSLIFYTPVRELIPGFPNKNVRLKTQRNSYRIDSLEWEMQKKDRLLESIERVLKNEEPINYSEYNEDISFPSETNTVARSPQDSAIRDIRAIVNRENSSNLIALDDSESKLLMSELFFFCPLEGDITYRFNLEANHLGTATLQENQRLRQGRNPHLHGDDQPH